MKRFLIITLRNIVSILFLIGAPCSVCMASTVSLQGVVQLGGTAKAKPLPNVTVSLYEATASQPNVLGQAVTDASGRFTIKAPAGTSSSVFYLGADLGQGVEFVTVLGPDLPSKATVNEFTTVAAAYSMAQFYKTGVISGDAFGLRIAATMNDNLVSPATGASSPVLLSSPNADQTISLRETRSLADLLNACAEDPSVTASLLSLTVASDGQAPDDTAVALANLARNPQQNVQAIYQLTTLGSQYAPALTQAPDAWTIAVKVNDSGDDKNLFGGPARLAFDSNGYAWVTNNVVQGTRNSSQTLMVLQPDGKPSNGANGTPVSPLTGGGVLGGAFGITIDPHGSVWEGNFGWGLKTPANIPMAHGNGSLSEFTASGEPVSPPRGYQGGPIQVQGVASDAEGNIWICSYSNDEIYVFLNGDPTRSVKFTEPSGSAPFDIAIAADGTAWVSNSGGFTGGGPSSIAKYKLSNGVLQQQFLHTIGSSLKGLSLDSEGNAWVASMANNTIYGFAPDGTMVANYDQRGGIDGPWDVTVDGDDNLWVTNFGPMALDSNFTAGRLSKLCGLIGKNCPAGAKPGDAISPATGFTMPSAGSQVLLHNGEPLYGTALLPSYAPMMRQTSSAIDRAGNVWSINNWKPSFLIDTVLNPGGDGILIFVGLATPPAQPAF